MISYISLISGMLMLPVLYSLLFLWYRREFKKEENQRARPFARKDERAALCIGELALVRFWSLQGR